MVSEHRAETDSIVNAGVIVTRAGLNAGIIETPRALSRPDTTTDPSKYPDSGSPHGPVPHPFCPYPVVIT
jgi:hypothetical protein